MPVRISKSTGGALAVLKKGVRVSSVSASSDCPGCAFCHAWVAWIMSQEPLYLAQMFKVMIWLLAVWAWASAIKVCRTGENRPVSPSTPQSQAVSVHVANFLFQVIRVKAHEAADIYFRAFPVFCAEGKKAQLGNAIFRARFDDVSHALSTRPMA